MNTNLNTILKQNWQNSTFPNACIIQTLDIEYDVEQVYLFIMQIMNYLDISDIKNNPEIYTIHPAKQNQTISIETIREMKNWYNKTPIFAQYKFCIITYPELMTINAANSCLKLLEEYNKNSFVILLSKNHQSLLQTILSRCRVIYSDIKTDFNEQEYKHLLEAICSKNVNVIANQYIKTLPEIQLCQYTIMMFNKIIKYQMNHNVILLEQENALFDILKRNNIQTNLKKYKKIYNIIQKVSGFDAKNISCLLLNEIFT